MDTGTGLTLLGTALGSKELIIKVLGPTAEYIGEGIKSLAQKRLENIGAIFRNASSKLDDGKQKEGIVSPKVLRGILNEGSYCDETLCTEYFGGVLASSKTGNGKDDRGAYFISLVNRLSVYQLRLHYIVYHIIKRLFDGSNAPIDSIDSRMKLGILIPTQIFELMMGFSTSESNGSNITFHTLLGLHKEELISETILNGSEAYSDIVSRGLPTNGIVLFPTILGIELFFWAYGKGQTDIRMFLNSEIKFSEFSEMPILDGAMELDFNQFISK